MNKILIYFLPYFFILSCASKVNIIKDDFYVITHYQTDYVSIQNWDTTLNLRFISKSDDIVLEIQYLSSTAFSVSENNKIILKFKDNEILELSYIDNVAKLNKEEVFKTIKGWFFDTLYIDTYMINASAKINNFYILTDIRIENSTKFNNLKFPENKAKELKRLFDEIKHINMVN